MGMAAMALISSSAGASSSRPEMGAAFTTTFAGDDIMEEHEVSHGSPLLRALGDVSLDEAMGTSH
jgi:hypothetical protein